MPTIDESVHIDRPTGDVYAFLVEADNAMLWQPNLIEYEQLDPAVKKGTRYRGINKLAGKKITWEAELTDYVKGKRAVLTSTTSPFPFSIAQTVEPDGAGSNFTWHQEVDSLGGFFGRMGDALVTRMYRRDVRANLARLKDLLEA